MANRSTDKQSEHDGAVRAAGQIYLENGKISWINPNGEKNKSWSARYIDVIAAEKSDADRAWVTEVETEGSVSDSEARLQWQDYAQAYTHWYLAVPIDLKSSAEGFLQKYNITNCTVITWRWNPNGTFTFWGLPGF